MTANPNRLTHLAEDKCKGLSVSQLTQSSPYLGIALLILFVFAGKIFRDNFKLKGAHWQRNCWLAGAVATACFTILAFSPFVQGQ